MSIFKRRVTYLACLSCCAYVACGTANAELVATVYEGVLPALSPAFVTNNESGMDGVFSQATFGADPIDIMFNPTASIVGLTNIATEADFNALTALAPAASPTVNMFFVDVLDWCNTVNTAIVGCAGGNFMVLESVAAGGMFGAELNSHELGHNLGLDHTGNIGNLMDPSLNGNTTLTAAQVVTINTDPNGIIQGMAPNRFVSITPILVTAVPEASSFILVGFIALSAIGCAVHPKASGR